MIVPARLSRLFLLAVCVALSTGPACRCASGDDRRGNAGGGGGQGNGTEGEGEGDADAWTQGDLAAQTPQDEGQPVDGGEVVVQIYSNPPSLNPIVDADWWAARIVEHHVYGCLVSLDPYDAPNYRVVPELAESWDISDDKLTYTYHLRHGVKWHDGHDFTSRDVIATIDKVMDDTVKAAHIRSSLEEMDSYSAPDDFTVVIKWKRPYFLALEDPFGELPIQPAHIIASMTGAQYNEAATNPLNRAPIGTGPFKFVRWQANERIVLERNDHFWGDAPHLDRIVFRQVEDAAIGLQLAERGELDVVTRMTGEQWSRMDSPALRENYRRSKFFDNNYGWIGWNEQRPFFQDKRVRRALTMLTDRHRLIDSLFYGVYREADCHFYWASPICQYEHEPIPYDPAGAVRLLEEAGWRDTDNDGVRDKDGVAFRFNFMVPASSEDAARMGTFLKESFERAGIAMEIQPVEWSAFTRRLTDKDFDACTLLWGSAGPRQDPTQIWHSSSINGGSNYINFRNERADHLMEQARTELDTDRRQAMYKELMQILWDEQPYTFIYVRPRLSLVSKRIRGVKESLMFWQYEDWWVPQDQRRNRGGGA